MSFLECNLTIDSSSGDLIYSKPFNNLFVSKRKDGGILIRLVEYQDEANNYAFDSKMFFFDEIETETLFDWLSKHIDPEEIKRICKKLDK